MLKHGFDMHNVYLSAPGDLERERDAIRSAIGDINEYAGMPVKILLCTVGLANDDQITGFRSAVAENIRQCAFYIQIFDDDWGPKNLFRKMFYLAAECRDDPQFPMREVVVFLKAAPRETDAEILAFRQELSDRTDMRVFAFDNIDALKRQMSAISGEWVQSILAAGGGVPESHAQGA